MTLSIDDLITVREKGKAPKLVRLGGLIAERLSYDPETGALTWTSAPRSLQRFIGTQATVPTAHGYLTVKIGGKCLLSHRVAFVLMTGDFPPEGKLVDHINGVKTDNRWCNLRLCSKAQNSHNNSTVYQNTSGFRGVHWDTRFSKWKAAIKANGKTYSLGSYDKKEDAIAARMEAVKRLHGEFAGRQQ